MTPALERAVEAVRAELRGTDASGISDRVVLAVLRAIWEPDEGICADMDFFAASRDEDTSAIITRYVDHLLEQAG